MMFGLYLVNFKENIKKLIIESKSILALLIFELLLILFGSMYFLIFKLNCIFVPKNSFLMYVFSIAITFVFTIIILKNKNIKNKILAILSSILPFIVIIFLILKFTSSSTEGENLNLFIIYAYIILICGIIIFFNFTHNNAIKIGLGIVYSITYLLVFVFLLLLLFFGNFSVNEIVNSKMSPNSTYLIEAIHNNQGALGGNSYVRISKRVLNIYFGTIERINYLYEDSRYGVLDGVTFFWETDDILYVDKTIYNMNEIFE